MPNSNDNRYREIKTRAFDRLLQAFLFLESRRSDYSEYQLAYHRCTRNLLAAQLLLLIGARTAAVHIANKILGIARKYQFVEITLSTATLLRDVYATSADEALFEKCVRLCNTCIEQLLAQYQSDDFLDSIRMLILNHPTEVADYEQTLDLILREHARLLQVQSSHHVKVNQFRLEVLSCVALSRPAGIIRSCEQALQYLHTNRSLIPTSLHGEFEMFRLKALLATGNEMQVRNEHVRVLQCFHQGSTDWFTCILGQVVALFRSGCYEDVPALLLMAVKHEGFQRDGANVVELFATQAAYLQLLHLMGMVSLSDETRADLQALLHHNSDNGITFSDLDLIIARTCTHIILARNEEALRMIESLESTSKSLRNDSLVQRAQHFVLLLVELVRTSTPTACGEEAESPSVQRIAPSTSRSFENWQSEPIPYERLYSYLLASIRSQSSWQQKES
ncbi:MAG: hypothetical protein FGM24_02175 [Candidatus Kapabacteria bacterium]|nr:hypothetical protein [Candidatus Kapabacteria bacterium]